MQFSFLTFILQLVFTGLLLAAGHGADGQTISLRLEHSRPQEVFKAIEQQAGVNFVYKPADLHGLPSLSLNIERQSLAAVLRQLEKLSPLSFRQSGKMIAVAKAVVPKKTKPELKETGPIPIMDSEEIVQQVTITGTVLSANDKKPLEGVTVFAKWSEQKTITNKEGAFSISTIPFDSYVFSCVGYINKDTLLTQENVRILLTLDSNNLKEVTVNAGYYETKKRFSTANIARIDAAAISSQPVNNILGAIQGRVAGLEITTQTGIMGGNYIVRIRGQNSLGNGNSPLYIIDGVPFSSESLTTTSTSGGIFGSWGDSPLAGLSPDDVQSLDVLKDADATAIYGSRGANGVILITTKSGKKGPTEISLNAYAGIGKVARKLELLNSQEYLQMRKEAFQNDGLIPNEATAPDLMVWDTTRYTDWQEELIGGSAATTDAQLSLSGGQQETKYLLGGGYHRESTVFPGDYDSRRLSGRFNFNSKSFNHRLDIGFTSYASSMQSNLPGQDLSALVAQLPPVAPPLYDNAGEINWVNSSWANPLSYMKQEYEAQQSTLSASINISITLPYSFRLKNSIGLNQASTKSFNTIPKSSYAPDIAGFMQNTTFFSDQSVKNINYEPQLDWSGKLGNANISVLIGGTILQKSTVQLGHNATGYTDEALMKTISQAPTISITNDYNGQYRYMAVYGRFNYNLAGRYLLNLTGRRDGSSRFAPEHRYSNFAAVGAAWVFSEEPLWRKLFPFLSQGKLRASYGITGNDQFADYLYMNNYRTEGLYQGIRVLASSGLYNPNLQWEANRKLEAAIELGMFRQRLQLSISYYRNRSTNQLIYNALPPNTGYQSIYLNLPASIQNKGIEIEVSTINTQGKLTWSSNITLSIPRNKLVSYPGLEKSTNSSKYVVGMPLSIVKTYQNLGVNPENGTYIYTDYNGDGSITTADMQLAIFKGIRASGGIQNSFHYGQFGLEIFIQGVKQTGTRYLPVYAPGTRNNQPRSILGRWHEPGQAADLPKLTTNDTWRVGDYGITDVSFFQVKNISLNYSLKSTTVHLIKAKGIRLYIQAQNVWTISGYKGLNPETQNESWLPPLRVITAGINVTF